MAYKVFDDFSADMKTPASATDSPQRISLQNEDQQRVDLPDSSFVRDADISRDGMDLVLETPEGSIIVEGYFAQVNPPALVAPDGMTLTPELVRSFAHSTQEYADASKGTSDASPVGAIQEISGEATVTRTDGTVETAGVGTPIYQGDVVETSEDGAVNIMFVDETTFAVSNDARLAIDEYVFDPATQSGTSNFSVLKGVFVFTSGLIGRDDPDDVEIDTPAGSIGIRGTIIAGDVDTGEITVIEGAIVLNDFSGNSITLSNQYETAKFNTAGNSIDHMGDLSANDVTTKFMSVSTVAANLFSSIQDSAKEAPENRTTQEPQKSAVPQQEETEVNEPAPDEQGALEGQQPAPAPMPEMITSEDIVTAGQQFAPEIRPALDLQDKPANLEPMEARPLALAPLPPPPMPLPENRPPFGLQITRADVQENLASGGTVAIIKGNFTDSITFHINGTAQNFFDAVRVDATTFRIFLKAGVSLDFEKAQRLHFTATNGSGAAIISDSVDLSVLNVNEPTIFTGATPNNVGTSNFFSASDGNTWSHSFAQDFADPDGDIAGYSYEIFDNVGTPIANLNAYGVQAGGLNFNTSNGAMTLDFTTTVADAQFRIIVHALDSGNTVLNSTSTIVFETFGRDIITPTGGNYIVPGGQYFSGAGATAETIVTGGNNSRVYANGGNDTVNAAGSNNYYNLGDGNDTLNNTSGTNHYAFGDDGQDTFNLSSITTSKFYGGNDNDTFNLQTTGVVTTLQGGTGIVIDGGAGYDTLHMNAAGNINFSVINDAFIKNMERFSSVNASANNITLTRDDVLAMTDGNRTLTIQMDANDTLDFVNGSTNQFFNMGQTSDNLYDIFSDGTITLLVSTAGNHAAGTDLP